MRKRPNCPQPNNQANLKTCLNIHFAQMYNSLKSTSIKNGDI